MNCLKSPLGNGGDFSFGFGRDCMRPILSYVFTLSLGAACVIGAFYLYGWAGRPAMYLALNPAADGTEGVAVSFANSQRHVQLLDADNFIYFLYPSPKDDGRHSVHIHVRPYSESVAERLTREANAIQLQPRVSTDIMNITPLVNELPAGRWMISALFQPSPTYTGNVLWNGLLRSPGFAVKIQ